MGIIDMFKFGIAVSDTISVAKAVGQLKKQYPDGYQAYKELQKVFIKSPLIHDPINTGFLSKRRLINLLNQPDLKILANVVGNEKRVTFVYRLENNIFAANNIELLRMCHWVNSNLYTGRLRFMLDPDNFLNINKRVVVVIFDLTLYYDGLNSQQLFSLIKRMLDTLIEYSETLYPLVKWTGKLEIEFPNGTPSGSQAQDAINKFNTSSTICKKVSYQIKQQLLSTASNCLSEQRIPSQKINGMDVIQFFLPNNWQIPLRYYVYVTDQSQIVVESHLVVTDQQDGILDIMANCEYMVYVNSFTNSSGWFDVNHKEGTIYYKTGIDVQEIEESVNTALIRNLLAEHQRMDVWLAGFNQVVNKRNAVDVISEIGYYFGDPNQREVAQMYFDYLEDMFQNNGPYLTLGIPSQSPQVQDEPFSEQTIQSEPPDQTTPAVIQNMATSLPANSSKTSSLPKTKTQCIDDKSKSGMGATTEVVVSPSSHQRPPPDKAYQQMNASPLTPVNRFCGYCGKKLLESAIFCPYCGKRSTR